jgi:hypothetical protein
MDPGEQITGTRDEHYDLISVLYHVLKGAENCDTYALDAEAAGDERLASFFREAQETQIELAERAKERLGILEVPPEPELAPDIPPESGIPPGATVGGMPSGSEATPGEVAGGTLQEGGLGPGDMAGGIPPQTPDIEPGRATSPVGAAAPAGGPPDTFGDVPPEVPPESPLGSGATRDVAPEDIPPRPEEVRANEVGASAGEASPMTDASRTSPGSAAPPPDERFIAEPRGKLPEESLQRATSPERRPQEAPPAGLAEDEVEAGGAPPSSEPDIPPPQIPVASPPEVDPEEPARTRPEQPAARRTEGDEKGLLDKAKDKLDEARDRLTGQ